MIVVDASALIEYLLRTPYAAGVARRLFAPGEQLHAPYLIDVEAAQVLRRYVLNGAIGAKRGRDALDDLDALPIHRWSHQFLLARVWELRNNLTAYDATYVALAEALNAPLLTRDRRMAAASGHRARVELA